MSSESRPIFKRLRERDQEIATLLMLGHPNRLIAEQLGTTEQVIKNKMRRIFDSVGAETRLQCALILIEEAKSSELVAAQ